jgi:hypothetical protein
MGSNAYKDFIERIRAATFVVRQAQGNWLPHGITGLSGGATVLVAAALERYLIDVSEEKAATAFPTDPAKLTPAQRRVLYLAMARRMAAVAGKVIDEDGGEPKRLARFGRVVLESWAALANPSSWKNLPRMGLFDESTKTIDKVERTLQGLDPLGRSIFDFAEEKGLGAVTSRTLLSALVGKRHEVAHAIEGSTPASPGDVRRWAVFVLKFVRLIEQFLDYRK